MINSKNHIKRRLKNFNTGVNRFAKLSPKFMLYLIKRSIYLELSGKRLCKVFYAKFTQITTVVKTSRNFKYCLEVKIKVKTNLTKEKFERESINIH